MDERSSQALNSERTSIVGRRSLEYELPLLFGGLLVVVILALATAAYVEVRRSSLRTASERLVTVTRQFRELLQQSGAQLRGQALATGRKPELAAFLTSRAPGDRARALQALHYAGAQPELVLAIELRDSTGARVLAAAPSGEAPTIDVASPDAEWRTAARAAKADSGIIGRYRLFRDTLVYPVVAPVAGSAGAYVVQWRKLAGSRRAREQLMRLVGSSASLFVGNADGTQWSDLERPVTVSIPASDSARPIQTYKRAHDRTKYLVSSARIPGTPWMTAVDIPVHAIMAPVDAFLAQMAIIAGAALLLGLAGTWFVSRRITAPLSALTDAADALTTGNYAQHVRVTRSDEIGRLGYAFNTMAKEVASSREELERKVDERTRDLNDTLRQLRDAQESLVRREKLAMLGQLASGVGHELRNPLGVMTNAIYYLKMVLASAPQNIVEYLDILQQQITLSEKIVGDLLDFARTKAPQRKPASLREITAAQVARLGSTNGVRIDRNLPEDLPAVLIDDVQVGQVVLNLLTNAMQAMDGTGTITIRAHADGDRVAYDVVDTGPGVAPENLEKIFEPLFTTKARGIGLGLAVSRTLARANGGDLTLVNEAGKGAAFRLTLPVAPAPTMMGAA